MSSYPKGLVFIQAYERRNSKPGYVGFESTYSESVVELAVLTQGKKKFYFMAYGSGYNCEDGVFIDILSQEEFDNKFSLVQLP